MRRLLVLLYPAAWRERYGAELEALMEDAPERGFDVLKGAFSMRLKYLPGWAILCGFAITGLFAGLVSSYLFTPEWKSVAVLRMTPKGVIPANVGAQQAYDLAAAQNDLMRRIQAEVSSMGILIRPQPWPLLTPGYIPTLIFTVDYRCENPTQAKAVVDDLIAKILPMSRADLNIDLLDSPRQSSRPISPNRPLLGTLGLATGLFLALFALLARRNTRTPGVQAA